jgi:hypothetical protein
MKRPRLLMACALGLGCGSTEGGGPPLVDAWAAADAAPMMMMSSCGVPEAEPNDNRDTATPVGNAVMMPSCLGSREDSDFYLLTAPADPAGGYYQVSITEVGDFAPYLAAYSVSDNGMIDYVYASSNGQNLHAFLAAAPGERYRLEVKSFAGLGGQAPARYRLAITYTRMEDAHEPNDTRETARPIALGSAITAFMFDGHRKASLRTDDVQDWYVVMNTSGTLTMKVENVPANLGAYIEMVDSTGRHEFAFSPTDGANAALTRPVTPGPVRLGVKPFAVAPDGFGKQDLPGVLPPAYTRPYTLTVTQ